MHLVRKKWLCFGYSCTLFLAPIIKFETFDMPGPPPEPIILTSKNKAWADVIRNLVDLRVDKWVAEYHDPSIMDGSGWSLSICSKELNIQSSGMNAYPETFDAVQEVIERAATTAPPPTKPTYARKPRKCPKCGAQIGWKFTRSPQCALVGATTKVHHHGGAGDHNHDDDDENECINIK